MASAVKTVTAEKITPEQAEALYVLANTKGAQQRREALMATGLDKVNIRPLIDAGVITVTKDGQLRLRSEGRLVAADSLSPERQQAFNAVIAGAVVGSTAALSPEERIEARSQEVADRELARRAALAAEATKEDWVRSVIRKAKPKRSDNYGTIKKKLNTLDAISLRQRAALNEDTREDFYDMYERLRVLMMLRKKYERAKAQSKKQELQAQIDAVFELVKNPSDDEIRRQRARERRVREARMTEGARQRAERLSKERVEREKRLSAERKKEALKRMPPHDAAITRARELIERFKRQRDRYDSGDRQKPPSAQIIKGDRGALGILSDERDRLSRALDEDNLQEKTELVDSLTQYAMSLVGLAPMPGEQLVPEMEGIVSPMRPAGQVLASQRAISRPMTHRKYGKFVMVRGRPRYDISTEELRKAKAQLEDALKTSDSKIQARKFADMQMGKKGADGKRLAGMVYASDPFFKPRNDEEYRRLWSEMRELLERKRRQGGGSLTKPREERLSWLQNKLAKMRRKSIDERKRIDSPAIRGRAKGMYDEITKELEDRKRILFEDHYKDVIAQKVPRVRAAREYLEDLADRMNRIRPGLGPKLKEQFAKLQPPFLLALDAAGQPDVKSKRKNIEFVLSNVLKDKANAAQGLAKAASDRDEQLAVIEKQPIPESVKRQQKDRLDKAVREYEALIASLEQKEKELREKLSLLSLDRMAKLTNRELLIAGLPDAGAESGLIEIGAQIRDAIASGKDPMVVVDDLLSQQAKPDYLRDIDAYATAQIKKGKTVATVGVKEALEEQRREERAKGAERKSKLATLEEQRRKLSKRLEATVDVDQRRRIQSAIDQMNEQIYKLRSGEILATGLMIDVMQETDRERSRIFQMLQFELKQTKNRLDTLLKGEPLSYKYLDGEKTVEVKNVCRVPDDKLEAAKMRSAYQAGIGTQVQSLVESGDARNVSSAVSILQSEIRFVREFSSKYQNEATKIVERFSELQSKVDASAGQLDRYIELKNQLDETIDQIKESEKRLKRSEQGGVSPAQRKQLLAELKIKREELSEELNAMPAPLQKAASVLVRQPTPRQPQVGATEPEVKLEGIRVASKRAADLERRQKNLAKKLLSLSEYEEYQQLKPKYDAIVKNAAPSEYGLLLLKPEQKPLEEALEQERKTRYEKMRSQEGKGLAIGEYPLVEQSQIDEYRRIFANTPEHKEQRKYDEQLGRLTRNFSRLAAYLRSYATKVKVDDVEYALKIFKPQRVTKAIYVSRSYGDKDYDELLALAKRQAVERATALKDLLSSQVAFNRALRNAIRGYKAFILDVRDGVNFKRDLKLASSLSIADREPTDDELAAQSRLLSRFNRVDDSAFSLPRGASLSNIDTRLASILTRAKQAFLVAAAEGIDLDVKKILETEGQLDDYEDIVKKAKIKDGAKRSASLAILAVIDAAFEEAKARGKDIVETRTVDNGEGSDGTQRVSVETFLSKDADYERATEYEERVQTKGIDVLTPQEAATLIRAELLQDEQIRKAAKRIEAERKEREKRRESYEAARKKMGLEVGERLHVLPAKFGDKKKIVLRPGALHTIVPVLKGKKDFQVRYGDRKVEKTVIALSRAEGQNAIREMIAMAGQIYRSSAPPPDKFELAVEVQAKKVALVAIYAPSKEAQEYLYKPAPEGWAPTGIIGFLEQKSRRYEEAQKAKPPIPFQWWDRYAEAYITRSMTQSPRAPILRRIKKKDSLEAKADRALNIKAGREALDNVQRAASQIPVMSEAEFDREFPAKHFERLSIPSVARPVTSRVDPDRIVSYKYTPVSEGGAILRLVAPRNISPERDKRALYGRYYAVQLRSLFTEEVLAQPERMQKMMYPHLDEDSKIGAAVKPLRKANLEWPRLAQFAVVNFRDKSVGLYIVFPKKVTDPDDPDVPTIIKMVQSSQAITDYELTRARVAARWVADKDNQPNKWAYIIRAAMGRKPKKNPGKGMRTIDPSKYVFVEFEPLLGKGIRRGIVKEARRVGQAERLSGHAGFRKMIRRNLDYDFFAIPKSKVSTRYMRYNKPYELYFDGETIFVNTPEEQIKSYMRLSPAGVPQPKAAAGVPRSSKLTSRVRSAMHALRMNPGSLEEYMRENQAKTRHKLTPPEIDDLQERLERYKQNQDGRTLRALVLKAQEAKKHPDKRVVKVAHDVLRELRKNRG
jgi:hypothetical protein